MLLGNQSPSLWAATLIDPYLLISNIKEVQKLDHLQTKSQNDGEWTKDPCWTLDRDSMLYYKGQIHVPNTGNLQLQVLNSRYNYVLASHPGQSKTYQMVHQDFNWPGLQEFVADYIRSCNICWRNRIHCHKPYGLLKQLPIPPQPWESISMDFIKQLPPSGGCKGHAWWGTQSHCSIVEQAF